MLARACYRPDDALRLFTLLGHSPIAVQNMQATAEAAQVKESPPAPTSSNTHVAAGASKGGVSMVPALLGSAGAEPPGESGLLTLLSSSSSSPPTSAHVAPQPSQRGFADELMERLMTNTPEARRASVQPAVPIADTIYRDKVCLICSSHELLLTHQRGSAIFGCLFTLSPLCTVVTRFSMFQCAI